MSGNDCHLYYRLNALPNDDQSKDLLLKSLTASPKSSELKLAKVEVLKTVHTDKQVHYLVSSKKPQEKKAPCGEGLEITSKGEYHSKVGGLTALNSD